MMRHTIRAGVVAALVGVMMYGLGGSVASTPGGRTTVIVIWALS